MKVTKFSEEVAKIEGGRKSISIAQIKEVLRIANELMNDTLYAIVKTLPVLALIIGFGPRPAYAEGSLMDQVYAGFVGNAKYAIESTTRGELRPGFHVNYVEVGQLNGGHIAALDASAAGTILEDKFESVKWSVGGKLHLAPFIKNYVRLPVGWEFLNTLEIDGRYSYDFTDRHPYLGIVCAYPFK